MELWGRVCYDTHMVLPLLFHLFLFGIATLALVRATGILIRTLNRLSRSTHIELFALTGFFSAVATSLPELFVGISSALSGQSQLALGLVFGSNIANVTLVAGTVTLVGGGMSVVGDFVKKDVLKAFGAIILPIVLMLDGRLSRFDGFLLIVTFLLYHVIMFQNRHKYSHELKQKPFTQIGRWLHGFQKKYQRIQLGWFMFGIVVLLFSADIIVRSGSEIARMLEIPVVLVGLFLVAMGTSLPELAFEIRAIRKRQVNMVLGDLLGSLVANSTLILGATAIFAPISLHSNELTYMNSSLAFLLGFFLLWTFLKTKLFLSRIEGLALISVYLLFFILQIGTVH